MPSTINIPTTIESRIITEVDQICAHSQRKAPEQRQALIDLRAKQWRHYYKFGSPSNIDLALRNTLKSYVLRSVHCQPEVLEDVLQNFVCECLRSFRTIHDLPTYSPNTSAELAELAAYCQRYAKRKINGRQLIGWRALRPADLRIVMQEESLEKWSDELDSYIAHDIPTHSQAVSDASAVVNNLIAYLSSKKQPDCIDYLYLRLKDYSPSEINQALGLSFRKRDHLQQRFVWQLHQFIASTAGNIYHDYFDLAHDNYFGLSAEHWAEITAGYHPRMVELKLKQNVTDKDIARTCGLTEGKVKRQWSQILLATKKKRSELAGYSRKPKAHATI